MVAAVGQAAAAIVSAIGLALSAIGLFLVWSQLKVAKKTADLHALQEFLEAASEQEKRLLSAETEEEKRHNFNEFMNFLEINAAAVNDNLYPKTAYKLVVDKLCSSIAVIEAEPWCCDQIKTSITHSSVFLELRKFYGRNRNTIKRCAEEHKISSNKADNLP